MNVLFKITMFSYSPGNACKPFEQSLSNGYVIFLEQHLTVSKRYVCVFLKETGPHSPKDECETFLM